MKGKGKAHHNSKYGYGIGVDQRGVNNRFRVVVNNKYYGVFGELEEAKRERNLAYNEEFGVEYSGV